MSEITMPMTLAEESEFVLNKLHEALERTGKDVITMGWGEFYNLTHNDLRFFSASMRDRVLAHARGGNVLIAFGSSTVLVAKDNNFAEYDK